MKTIPTFGVSQHLSSLLDALDLLTILLTTSLILKTNSALTAQYQVVLLLGSSNRSMPTSPTSKNQAAKSSCPSNMLHQQPSFKPLSMVQ
jgi:hypothetical protein